MTLSSADVHLKVYDVLEAAMFGLNVQASIEAVRAELETLARDELLVVATALSVETTARLVPRSAKAELWTRLEKARLAVMWEAS